MKILLLTDVPPSENCAGGLVLDRLIRFLPKKSIAICSIVNPYFKPIIAEDLSDIPHLSLKKPSEASNDTFIRLGITLRISKCLAEFHSAMYVRFKLMPKVIEFIKQQKIDVIWVVLEGQTIVRVTHHLLRKLKIPVFSQVWDPFEWWLRDNEVDRLAQKHLLKIFDGVLRQSQVCATASWPMSEYYTEKYAVPNIPVIAGLPRECVMPAACLPRTGEKFVITLAGQVYARDAWESLVHALQQAKWQVAGRTVSLQLIGDIKGLPVWIGVDYTGRLSQEETLTLLANSDLLYLPYWFSKKFWREASLCFPSKMVSYFAAGRPVFCHAPDYAAPTKYIVEHKAGYVCSSLDSQDILQCLTGVIEDGEKYKKFAEQGYHCFMRDFTLEKMKQSFFNFLQLDASTTSAS